MTLEIADYVEVKLATPFDPGSDTTVDVVATNDIYEMVDQKTSSVFQDFRMSIYEKTDITQKIRVGITSAVANGTLGGKNRYTLTILDSDSANSMIGIANTDDGTDADANIIAGNVSSLTISEFSTDSICRIAVGAGEYNDMKTTFSAGNTFNTVTEGETLADTESVSLHTDGKTYKYHFTNYPNLVGVQTSTTGKYITFGGLSTGHSGLTVGAVQYAENTGAVTETASATTKYLGVAESATTIRIAPSTPSELEAASQAEAEAGTDNVKYTTSLRVKQATTADTTIIHTTGDYSLAGTIVFADDKARSTTNAAPTDEDSFTNKKYVDDQILAASGVKMWARDGSASADGNITNFTEVVDTGSDMSGGTFTVPTTGNYLISFGAQFPAGSAANYGGLEIRKNGTIITGTELNVGGVDTYVTYNSKTVIAALTAADTITVYFDETNGSYSVSQAFLTIHEL